MSLVHLLRGRLGLLLVLCLAGGVIGALMAPREPTPSDGGLVFAADAVVYENTLGEWSARHWQWTLAQPIGSNPGQDVTGADCGLNQEGPVFFVPRNFPPCTVPTDTIILVPIVGAECSTVEPFPYYGETEDELRTCAASDVDRYTNITFRIDGEAVEQVQLHRAMTPLFTVTLPERNVLGVTPGEADMVADGYQLLLAPLPAGEHEIMVHVELADGLELPDKVLQLTVANTTTP